MPVLAGAHYPSVLDKGPLERARRPLAVAAAVLLAVDMIVLGLHLADAVKSPLADDTPTSARARIGAPEAVVPGGAASRADQQRRAAADESGPARPLGCLALASGCYPAQPTASPSASPGARPPTGAPATAPPPTSPVPVAQADAAVPALGAQVSVGAGDGSCTSVELTVLALGDCPIESADGPVVLNLGGSLLGD